MSPSPWKSLASAAVTLAALVGLWGLLVVWTEVPRYLLPGPRDVWTSLVAHADLLWEHTLFTLSEILWGGLLGVGLGMISALLLDAMPWFKRAVFPLMLVWQSVPTFAVAPLLVLWFGYGALSKVIMTGLVMFFPITVGFLDGLSRTERPWKELAAALKSSRWRTLVHLRIPAALPGLASGLRVAIGIAPISAVVGEWIGSTRGLGFVMMDANRRFDIPLVFAALTVLGVVGVTLYVGFSFWMNRTWDWSFRTQKTLWDEQTHSK